MKSNLQLAEGECNLQPATCRRQTNGECDLQPATCNSPKANLTAVVTGASSGIGREYARQLCEKGYEVVMVSNEDIPLREAAEEFAAKYGTRTYPVCMNLAVPDAAVRLHEFCRERGFTVDILVNNAGVFYFEQVVDVPVDRVELMLTLHVTTPTMLCRLFGEDMKSRRRGYILNMSSASAWLPYPSISLYASTKVFLRNFSRAFRLEMLDHGVSVTAVCPGAVATDLYNLPRHLQRLALRLGVMMTPRSLARCGLRAMFRRRARVIPGIFNYFMIGTLKLVPLGVIRWAIREVDRRIKGKKNETRLGNSHGC